MNTLLSYNSVDICYGGANVVRNINFSLQPGEILGIVGESGSGKSTIIKAAMGLLGQSGTVTKGEIWFQGKNLTKLNTKAMRKICGIKIGMVFQDSESFLSPIRTIGSQIYESMRAHLRITKEESKEKALELLSKLNFKDGKKILNSYPFELSGGMNQRVGIVMAMIMNPHLLLADEPTSALDVSTQKQIMDNILFLREQHGMAVILVSHNIELVSTMSDSIIVLKDGDIKEFGPAQKILNHSQNEYTRALLAAVPKLKRK